MTNQWGYLSIIVCVGKGGGISRCIVYIGSRCNIGSSIGSRVLLIAVLDDEYSSQDYTECQGQSYSQDIPIGDIIARNLIASSYKGYDGEVNLVFGVVVDKNKTREEALFDIYQVSI